MNAAALKEQAPAARLCDAALRTFASAAAGALYDAITHSAGTDILDHLARALARGYVDGAIDDNDLAFLQSLIDRKRQLPVGRRGAGTSRAFSKLVSRFIPRQRARSRDRQASRDRRRMLGGSAVMPPQLRHFYTEGQRAVMCVIAGEVKVTGNCDLPVDKIAALAGVCRTTVQTTLHEARRLGHIKVTERPQPGRKNLTNIVRICSAEWLTWIKRGPTAHRPCRIGSNSMKMVSPTKSTYKKKLGEKERRRGSGPPQTSWGRRA